MPETTTSRARAGIRWGPIAGIGCLVLVLGVASISGFLLLLSNLQERLRASGSDVASEASAVSEPGDAPAAAPTMTTDALVLREVGPFKLLATQRFDEAFEAGAVDGVQIGYVGPDGVMVSHALTIWPRREDAHAWMIAEARRVTVDHGFRRTHEEALPVLNGEQEQVGERILLERGDEEYVFWTNDVLASHCFGPTPVAQNFERKLSY